MKRPFAISSLLITLVGGVLVTVWFMFGGEQQLLDTKSWLAQYHWALTLIRISVFIGIIAISFYFETRSLGLTDAENSAVLTLHQLFHTRTFRLAIWLGVLELVIGQGLIVHLLALILP